MSFVSPNMGLIIPSVTTEVGPAWASLLNAALEAIDSHTHQTGSGVKITPAAININAALDFNGWAATEVDSVQLSDRIANISARGVYAKSGELFYKDTAGNAVQITNGGSLAGVNGAISNLASPAGALFSANTFFWTYDSSKYARMANSDIILYPYDASTAYTKSISIKAPVGLEAASSYSLTLPTIVPPSQVEFVSIGTTGILDHATLAGTANQVAVAQSATAITLSLPATVATTQFSTGLGLVSAPAYTFTADSNTGVYSEGADLLSIALGGAEKVRFSGSQALLSDGTALLPAVSFLSDPNTGVYSVGADSIGASTGGTLRLTLSTTALTSTLPYVAPLGAAATPSHTFVGDLNTGVYSAGADTLNFATGGVLAGAFDSSGRLGIIAGAEATPGINFLADPNTGFYSIGADQIGASTGGTLRLTLSTTALTSTLPYIAPVGSAGAPTFTFTGDTNTGVYNAGADVLGFATGGTVRTVIGSDGQVRSISGSATAPTYAYSSDSGTGVYLSAANTLSFATASTLAASFDSGGRLGLIAGAAATPALNFLGDPNTGLYNTGADQLGVSTGGTLRLTVSTAAVTSTLPYIAPLGAVGAPSFTFAGDTNTGIYSATADTINFSIGGSNKATLDSSGNFNVSDGLNTAPSVTFLSDPDTGMYHNTTNTIGFAAAGATVAIMDSSNAIKTVNSKDINVAGSSLLNFSSSSAAILMQTGIGDEPPFKISFKSGTIASGVTVSFATSATVYSASGWASRGAAAGYTSIGPEPASNYDVYFLSGSSSSTTVAIRNNGANTQTYNIMVIHA